MSQATLLTTRMVIQRPTVRFAKFLRGTLFVSVQETLWWSAFGVFVWIREFVTKLMPNTKSTFAMYSGNPCVADCVLILRCWGNLAEDSILPRSFAWRTTLSRRK